MSPVRFRVRHETSTTTVLDTEQARLLLDSIDASTVAGLRDRPVTSVMTSAFARIARSSPCDVEDYYPKGKRRWVRLHEKGGKRHDMLGATSRATTGGDRLNPCSGCAQQ
jgi:site-specific recombinase XerC